MLAFEPPRHGGRATLGGIVATGFSGPRRAQAGAVRDFVLGVRIVDGTGEALAFGGQVIKNVAGFDVSRLMTGALGTLGVLTEISLKTLPRPRRETTRVIDCGGAERCDSSTNGAASHCRCRRRAMSTGGSGFDCPAHPQRLRRDRGYRRRRGDGDAFWRSIRDQTHERFVAATQGDAALWRLSVSRRRLARRAGRTGGRVGRRAALDRRDEAHRRRRFAHGPRNTAAMRRCTAARTSQPACSIRCRRRWLRCIVA